MINWEQIRKNIREAYLVKFGNLYIEKKDKGIPKVEHCYAVRPWALIPKTGAPPPLEIEKLVNCFKKSPNVERVTLNSETELKYVGLYFDPHTRWHFEPVLRLDLNIPVENQEVTKLTKKRFGDRVEETTKFTVFYDGSNYIITTEVKDFTKFHVVADVRDFLHNLLKEDFVVEDIPPNPMREDYYFLFLSDTDIKTIKEPEIMINKGTIIIPKKEEELKSKNEIFSNLLVESRLFLDIFYAGSMIAVNLQKKYVKLNKLHREIQKKIGELSTTPNYSLFKRSKIRKKYRRINS